MVGQMGSKRHAGRGAQTGLGWWTTACRSVASQDQGMAKTLLLVGPGALHVESCVAFCLEGNTGL